MDQDKQQQFELLKTFHEQFAQNQNHHQNLFIKFLSAVFIVIAAYFIVYANTQSQAEWHNIKYHANSNDILSYAIWHLIGVYFIAQIIFNIMVVIIANMAYNFRRDQKVNYAIRKEYLRLPLYTNIFGDRAFNPANLNFRDYQPGFHFIFFLSLLVLQSVLFISIIIKSQSINGLYNCFGLIIFFTPIVFTMLVYPYYYFKYKKKVAD